MSRITEHSTGIFAIGTLLATDDLVADEIQALGLKVRGRQLGWVTAEGTLRDAYRTLLTTRVGDRVVWLLSRDETSTCLLYTSPSPRDRQKSRMPSSA